MDISGCPGPPPAASANPPPTLTTMVGHHPALARARPIRANQQQQQQHHHLAAGNDNHPQQQQHHLTGGNGNHGGGGGYRVAGASNKGNNNNNNNINAGGQLMTAEGNNIQQQLTVQTGGLSPTQPHPHHHPHHHGQIQASQQQIQHHQALFLSRALSLGAPIVQNHQENAPTAPTGSVDLFPPPPPPLPLPPSHQPTNKKLQLSAQDLTGAPLISYVPKNKMRIKKKMSEPGPRSRHSSQPSFYLGQNLYSHLHLQDFYQNPVYTVQSHPYYGLDPNMVNAMHANNNMRNEPLSAQHSLNSYSNSNSKGMEEHKAALERRASAAASDKRFAANSHKTVNDPASDSQSESSDDMEDFVPRIIRPRRRRRKEKRKLLNSAQGNNGQSSGRMGQASAHTGNIANSEANHAEDTNNDISLGTAEKQWLPQGLLSAESSYDSRSESVSSEEESGSTGGKLAGSGQLRLKKKLAATLSMPVYSSGSSGSSPASYASLSHEESVRAASCECSCHSSHVKSSSQTLGELGCPPSEPKSPTTSTSSGSSSVARYTEARGHCNSSDYGSLHSNHSDTPRTSSSDHLCDSDSSRSESESQSIKSRSQAMQIIRDSLMHSLGKQSSEVSNKTALKMTKSSSTSYFRSPKLEQKSGMSTLNDSSRRDQAGSNGQNPQELNNVGRENNKHANINNKRHLRKTNSWHPASQEAMENQGAGVSFSLFSPLGSIDLLSGVRNNLSRLDLSSDQ